MLERQDCAIAPDYPPGRQPASCLLARHGLRPWQPPEPPKKRVPKKLHSRADPISLNDLRKSPALRAANELGSKRQQVTHFEVGQRVYHAEYGEGVLERISGNGPRAVAAVRFTNTHRTRSFVLAHGGLQLLE